MKILFWNIVGKMVFLAKNKEGIEMPRGKKSSETGAIDFGNLSFDELSQEASAFVEAITRNEWGFVADNMSEVEKAATYLLDAMASGKVVKFSLCRAIAGKQFPHDAEARESRAMAIFSAMKRGKLYATGGVETLRQEKIEGSKDTILVPAPFKAREKKSK